MFPDRLGDVESITATMKNGESTAIDLGFALGYFPAEQEGMMDTRLFAKCNAGHMLLGMAVMAQSLEAHAGLPLNITYKLSRIAKDLEQMAYKAFEAISAEEEKQPKLGGVLGEIMQMNDEEKGR